MNKNSSVLRWWLLLLPCVLIFYGSLWLSLIIRYPYGLEAQALQEHYRNFTIVYVLWMAIFFIHNLFDFSTFRRYTTMVFNLSSAMGVSVLAAALYFYAQPNLLITPRRFLLLHGIITWACVLIWYVLVKHIFRRYIHQDVYLFQRDQELSDLEQEINNHAYLGFRVAGYLEQERLTTQVFAPGSGIILPDNLAAYPDALHRFYELRKSGVLFFNHRDFFESLLRRVYLSQLNELWFLENIHYKERPMYNFFKRICDLAAGVVLLVIFLVTAPIIALAIKLSSSGPVFFVQPRVGRKNNPFQIYKYRTMTSGFPTNTWTRPQDFRITSVGKFLRRSRLDELPQCLNLLRGTLSLVGPRPEQIGIAKELRQAIPFYDERHIIKPGITGWAQLHTYAGSVEETKLKLQYDLYYVKHRSLLFDLEIILKTFYHFFVWSGQ